MSAKLLISGEANSGKTSLLSTLTDVLVIAHDGKRYPFPQPHVNVDTFDSMQAFVDLITEKIIAYKERFGSKPSTVVIDSVSKVFDTALDNCNTKFTGFNIYSNLNKEIHILTDYIENTLIASDINVVIISHAVYDADTTNYNLVGKGEYCLAA